MSRGLLSFVNALDSPIRTWCTRLSLELSITEEMWLFMGILRILEWFSVFTKLLFSEKNIGGSCVRFLEPP